MFCLVQLMILPTALQTQKSCYEKKTFTNRTLHVNIYNSGF